MARRRFAGIFSGASLTAIKTIAIALGAMAAAASLAGCGTEPLSVEESLYFDKATGADITDVPPGLRITKRPAIRIRGRRPPP